MILSEAADGFDRAWPSDEDHDLDVGIARERALALRALLAFAGAAGHSVPGCRLTTLALWHRAPVEELVVYRL